MAIHETSSKDADEPVWAVPFRYKVNKRSYTSTSYAEHAPFDVGESVRIEYLQARPNRARITEMRSHRFGYGSILMLFLPFMASIFVRKQLRDGLDTLHRFSLGRQDEANIDAAKQWWRLLPGPILALLGILYFALVAYVELAP